MKVWEQVVSELMQSEGQRGVEFRSAHHGVDGGEE
jgi:hypothetical protein